jgi:Tol biopolymer transport system component
LLDLPDDLLQNLKTPLIAFINQNDRVATGDRRTPQPATGVETLYYVSPTNSSERIPILQLPASIGNQVFISANGNSIAYFQEDATSQSSGLYVIDLDNGYGGRILPLNSLVQRGFVSEPAWSPDGLQIAVALTTGYDIDIFTIGRDGTNLRNITHSGAYDVWPSWSPDGRYLMFVSDRARCPSWIPGDSDACDPAQGDQPPTGGNIYVVEIVTGRVQKLADQWVTEPPHWLNERQVVFSVGDPTFGDDERTLWISDISTSQIRQVRPINATDNPIRLSEAWAPDGSAVVYQSIGNNSTEVIAVQSDGTLIGRVSELAFPRFGMSADWSIDSSRVAIGGINGQCPYGARVLDNNMNVITRGNPPPSMCNPMYSPDGQWLAFTGANPRIDGRVDVYVANMNGSGAVNLTGSLRGIITLVGWVGGTS